MQAYVAGQKKENKDFFSSGLERLGAEAQIILEYYDSEHSRRFSMTIYRYKRAEDLDVIWKRCRERPVSSVATLEPV
jgi:hypothetical protein